MQVDTQGRTFEVLRAFSIPKRDDTANEDRWKHSPDDKTFAVSDGASVSFDSAPWAQILCSHFISNPDISRKWLQNAAAEYNAVYDREAMPWMQQGAFDRGSFATLIGVVLADDAKSARIFSAGDSIFALTDRRQLICTIPYTAPDEFDHSPTLFSTSAFENTFWTDDAISESWRELNLSSHEEPVLLMMTDALGRWLIERPESVSTLLDIKDENEFAQLVAKERAEGRLKRDDSTLLVIGVAA